MTNIMDLSESDKRKKAGAAPQKPKQKAEGLGCVRRAGLGGTGARIFLMITSSQKLRTFMYHTYFKNIANAIYSIYTMYNIYIYMVHIYI